MEEYITRKEHETFAELMKEQNNRIADENIRQNHRIDALEENMKEIRTLTVSVGDLASSMKGMVREQERQGEQLDKQAEKLDELKAEPGKKWDKLTYGIIGALASGLGAMILTNVIH